MDPCSNIQVQLTSRQDHEFLLTQYCLFTKKQVLFYMIQKDFVFFFKQAELDYYYLSFGVFLLTAVVKYN